MQVSVFDAKKYDRQALETANQGQHDLRFLEARLGPDTISLAAGSEAVCCFVNDCADRKVLQQLNELGIKIIALRCAGFNNVDLKAAQEFGIQVARVPEYSPYAVAEHAVALILDHNRKIHRAFNRVRELNFSLDGLVGYDLHGKTVGVVGTGTIGKVFSQIMKGFGCNLIGHDPYPSDQWAASIGLQYVGKEALFEQSDIISLHMPLTPETTHFVDADAFSQMKSNAVIVNTGRGGLIDTKALIKALKKHSIGGACLDVYEEEQGVFFSDFSEYGLDDDDLARLITFPNVLITSHQAFLTTEALTNIATTTIENLSNFEKQRPLGEAFVTASM